MNHIVNRANITIRVDKSLKAGAESLFADLGLSLSTAFSIFLRQSLMKQGLPFTVPRSTPNFNTLKAIKEAEEIAADPNARSYGTVEELFEYAGK